jgi:hypothetical protein
MGATDSRALPSGSLRDIRASPRRSRRAPGPALQGLLALLIYAAVFAWLAMPLIRDVRLPVIARALPDSNFYIWAFRWLPYAMSHGLNPLYTNQILAPGGVDLAWTTPVVPVAFAMWPVTAAFGPIASYNLALLMVPPVTGWAAFIAARRLTGRFWASLAAGSVYGFSPYMMRWDNHGELNLIAITLFPLLVYLVLLWRDGSLGRTGFVLWTTAVLTLQFYICTEFFADVTVMLAVTLLAGYAVAGRAGRPAVARVAVLTAVAYAGTLLLASPYLFYALQRYPGQLSRLGPSYSLHLVRLILPPPSGCLWLRSLLAYSSNLGMPSADAYVGIPLLLLLVLLAAFTWKSNVTRLLVLVFVIVIAIAAGPNLVVTGSPVLALPWSGVWGLPIARSAEPDRFITFGILILALALALWLAAPAASRLERAARWGIGVLALVTIIAGMPAFPLQVPAWVAHRSATSKRPAEALPRFFTRGLYRQYLKPGEIVLVASYRGNAGMLFQAYSGFYFRIAGGYINESLSGTYPPPVEALADPATRATIRQFQEFARDSHLGAVLVEQLWAEPWMSVFGRMGMHGTSVGGVTVYQLPDPGDSAPTRPGQLLRS